MDSETRCFVVAPRAAGMRADVYLSARIAAWSRRIAADAIRSGGVQSNLRVLKPSTLLREGEMLALHGEEFAAGDKPECPPLVHADERILVYDKSPGLLCHPVGEGFTWGLINLARERFPEDTLHLAHRLDRETSGLVVLTRDMEANRSLKAAFANRKIAKTYLALLRGVVQWQEKVIDAPIGDDTDSPIRLRQSVSESGQPARTRFEVLERGGNMSLVRCEPLTGRTHQIRVHAEALGHPVWGDKIYGQDPEVFLSIYEKRPLPDLAERLGHPRHCLHALALRIPHPNGGELELEAPLPADMASLLERSSARGQATLGHA